MLTKEELLQKLADKYDDWFNMASSFRIGKSEAEELVQEMFVRIFDYVKDPQKIMYNKDEVNTFYIYITLRNLYYANVHTSGRKNQIIFPTDKITDDNFQGIYEDSMDTIETKTELEEKLERIEAIVNDWYWYDRGIFNLYYKKGMSMREIAKETKISLSSIFNTLKNAKEVVRKKTSRD
jgi:RNA polymerase sigma factor (sigma-70 family)